MSESIEVVETPVTPFRVFNDLSYRKIETPENWGGIVFSIRPMSFSEREQFNLAEKVFQSTKAFEKAVEQCDVDLVKLMASVDADGNVIDNDYAYKWLEIESKCDVDEDATKVFNEKRKEMIIACVDTVTVDGESKTFDAELFESISSVSVVNWLVKSIRNASNLSVDEVTSL